MKIISALLASILSTTLYGQSIENSIITVTFNDGSQQHFDGAKWMIKPRNEKSNSCPEVEQVKCPTETTEPEIVEKIVEKEIIKTINLTKHNYVSLFAGYGPTGLILNSKPDDENTNINVKKDFGIVSGIRYTRIVNDTWNVSMQYLTNHTSTVGVGYGW